MYALSYASNFSFTSNLLVRDEMFSTFPCPSLSLLDIHLSFLVKMTAAAVVILNSRFVM